MPLTLYHTLAPPSLQPALLDDDPWTTTLVPQLPPARDLYARHLGAIQRQRGITQSSDLLRALLAYALGLASFRLLGAWAVVRDLADLSDAAWRKRLRTANAWLLWLLSELCAAPPAAAPATTGRRVLLVDATVLGVPGGSGADWRVHTAYDFQAGHLSQVVVADRHTGEHLDHYTLQPDDIVVADGGYGYRRSVATVRQAQADAVLRINLQTFPLVQRDGTPLNLARWVATGRKRVRQRWVYCVYKRTQYAVRVIAVRLTPAAAQRAQLRARKRAKMDRRQARPRNLKLTGWLVLVTTLATRTWPAQAVAHLYRARWQIELVFKRLKSLLQLDHLRVKQPQAVEAVVRLVLIGWLLQAEEAASVRSVLTQVHTGGDLPDQATVSAPAALSSWRVTSLCLLTVRQQVLGTWTGAQVAACGPRLVRFLGTERRKRPHHETRLRAWLAAHSA